MFGLFRKIEWRDDVVSEMQGSANGIHVVIRSFP